MAFNDYVAADGLTYKRKAFAGTGILGGEFVAEFGDVTAHTKIDLVRTTLTAQLPTALSNGRLATESSLVTTAPLRYSAMGTAVSANIKNTQGSLFTIACTNLAAATRYLQLFNLTTTPSGGATPFRSYPVFAGGFFVLESPFWGSIDTGVGLFFSTGISFGFSTTPLVYTAGSASDCIFEASYL